MKFRAIPFIDICKTLIKEEGLKSGPFVRFNCPHCSREDGGKHKHSVYSNPITGEFKCFRCRIFKGVGAYQFVSQYFGQNEEKIRDFFDKSYNIKIENEEGLNISNQNTSIAEFTDTGNARRLVDKFGEDIRYDHFQKVWYIWNGKYWQQDSAGKLVQFAMTIGEDLRMIAFEINAENSEYNEKYQKAMLRFADRSQNKVGIDAMIGLAQTDPEIVLDNIRFNSKSMLFNLRNGTYSFSIMKFRKHQKEDLITNIVDYEFDSRAKCGTWIKFLKTIIVDENGNSDNNSIKTIQKIIGYALTGQGNLDKLIFLIGTGNNGKTTFVLVLEQLFGSYHIKINTETLITSTYSGKDVPDSNIADMKDKYLVTTMESQEDTRLDEAAIKNLTGGDPIRARRQYKQPEIFKPNFTIIAYGNHEPLIKGTDKGLWRRLFFIPFSYSFPLSDKINERDKFVEQFKNELPGIFNWGVQGYKMYLKEGLQPSENIVKRTKKYINDNDTIGRFINEHMELCQPGDSEWEYLQDFTTPIIKIRKGIERMVQDERGPYSKSPSSQKIRKYLESRGYLVDNDTANNNILSLYGAKLDDQYLDEYMRLKEERPGF